ncbi:hypothetical protein [Dankookia sp. P2]|uniref:hypothetical protein n=1 Tax=Dankookia sp. P2 TaxID=3423955 RepID=UPI003D672F64
MVTLSIDPQLAEPPPRSFGELVGQMGAPADRLAAESLATTADPRLGAYRRLQDKVQKALFWAALLALAGIAALAWRARRGAAAGDCRPGSGPSAGQCLPGRRTLRRAWPLPEPHYLAGDRDGGDGWRGGAAAAPGDRVPRRARDGPASGRAV